jgi:hypothetical protein
VIFREKASGKAIRNRPELDHVPTKHHLESGGGNRRRTGSPMRAHLELLVRLPFDFGRQYAANSSSEFLDGNLRTQAACGLFKPSSLLCGAKGWFFLLGHEA